MKIALDPYMLRAKPLPEIIHLAGDLGYDYIELSPRPDFIPFYVHPRADDDLVAKVASSLKETGIRMASVLPLYRWAGPDEDDRRAAVGYWKRAIEVTAALGCPVMNSEFNGSPEQPDRSEAIFWRSLEELAPWFEREGIALNLEAHPNDFCERNDEAVDLVTAINLPWVNYLYCAPHTFHLDDGVGDVAKMLDYAAPKLRHVHVADSMNHRASSGLRFVVNPAGSTARVHQHLDIGQGDVDWDAFFGGLRRLCFDGIVTACVFGNEERALQSSADILTRIKAELVDPRTDQQTDRRGHSDAADR